MMKKRLLSFLCAALLGLAQTRGQAVDEGTTSDPLYYPGDIAVINAIIDNNGLQWTKANPAGRRK